MIEPKSIPTPARVAPDARPARRITWDSREVNEETAFAALAGEKRHGNEFIRQALEQGAPFVLTDLDVPRAVNVEDAGGALRTWGRAARDKLSAPVIGITGSVGKTTAKAYAGAALAGRFMPVYNTLNAIACFLLNEHGLLSERSLLEEAQESAPLIVELGIDRIGEMAELMHLVAPSVGVVTSVGEAHLEAFGTRNVIAREKGLILQTGRKLVGAQASEWYPGVPTYGFEGADFAGQDLELSPDGARFSYRGVAIALPGANRVQAEAAVLGLALAELHGVGLEEAAARLAQVDVPGGRYRVHRGAVTIIDDTYNASPLSVKAALDALTTFPGRRISVLGRMLELGQGEAKLHREVGEYARARADLTFGVGAYGAQLGERAFPTVTDLLPALLAEVRPGDVVLVKASRGISLTLEERDSRGVGLETVVQTLLEERHALV